MKNLLLVSSLLFTFSATAATVSETINKIEVEKNAKCELLRESVSVCLNNYCRNNVFFSCISNDQDFGLKLNVRYYNFNGRISNELVRKVTFL